MDENYTISIKDTGLFIFTYYEPKIVKLSYGMHSSYSYEICGKEIEGFEEDRYSNGNLRIRGNFVHGKPKDSLVTFYPNGQTEKRFTYLPKEIFIEGYDSLGNLVKVDHNSNKSSYYRTDYKTIEYYTNGKVKLKESRVDLLVRTKEYYPGGKAKIIQTKNRRTEYYENGNKEIVYTWKRKSDTIISGEHDFNYTITKKIFNATGVLSEMQVYEHWFIYGSQPPLEFQKCDWINKYIKWDNGKEIIIAIDQDPGKFFKKVSQ